MLPISRTLLAWGVSAMLVSPVPAAAGSAALSALFDDYQEWYSRSYPESAMARGDYRYADRISDYSLAAIEQRHADVQLFAERVRLIEPAGLSPAERLNRDLFELLMAQAVEGNRFRSFLMPIHGRQGPQQEIPQMHERVRFAQREDFENYLKRLEQVPGAIDSTIALLQQGLREGRTPPRVVMQGIPQQFAAVLNGGLDELAGPLASAGAVLEPAALADLRARFESRVRPDLRASLRKLAGFVSDEYVPRCRAEIAAAALPDGREYYEFMLRTMTTTDWSAAKIHEVGLAEVARIRAEMMDVIRRSGFLQQSPDALGLDDAVLFKRFVEHLRTSPQFYYTRPEDLLAGYRDVCKRIDATLPALFSKLPRTPYGVREIPAFMAPTQTTAYYQPGDMRNAQPGYFYANTYKLDQRPKYEMIALSMHEAVPGHHLQIALAQELENVPEFRRDAWFTAFGEGWALYAERLGLEVGLYSDPYDDFGRLLYEMWRACRLVVDPGMHALGWSRQQAIQFMLDNTALSPLNIENEIDRYIAWPGQATAYKVGELKIRELRAFAERSLGERFDLRGFHDVILAEGSIPLNLLEQRVHEWVRSR